MAKSRTHGIIAILISALLLSSIWIFNSAPVETAPMRVLAGTHGNLLVNVTDEAGRPISDVNVTITGNTSYWYTGSNGSAFIPNVSIGWKTINTVKTGYLSNSETVNITADVTNYVTIVITGGMLLGSVLSIINGAIANATVQLVGFPQFNNITQSDGSYNIVGIPTGSYGVLVSAQGYSPATAIVNIVAGGFTQKLFSLIKQYGSIEGLVLEAGSPIQGVNITVTIDKIKHTAESAIDGYYQLPSVPEGNYTVTASKQGYSSITIDNVVVTNGNLTILNFNLTSQPAILIGAVTATISVGTILVFGALVEILTTGLNTTTSSQGIYSINNVPIGVYTVRTSAPGYEDNLTSGVAFERGKVIELDIILIAKPGQLTGVVRDRDTYDPIPGYKVTITGPDQRETTTNELGQYIFAGLKTGNYSITVIGPSTGARYSPFSASEIEISADDVTEYDIYLLPVKEALGGFVFGMDLPHSFMVLGFGIMIIILSLAIYLRLKALQNPAKAKKEIAEEIAAEDEQESAEERIEEKLEADEPPT